MFLFSKKSRFLKYKFDQIEDNLRESFSKAKEDISSINTWLTYYYQRSQFFESQLNTLLKANDNLTAETSHISHSLDSNSRQIADLRHDIDKLSSQPAVPYATKDFVEENLNFHMERISRQILKMETKLEDISYLPASLDALKEQVSEHIAQPHDLTAVEKRVDEISEQLKNLVIKRSPKAKLIQKVTKNSHDYIKAMVISYIKKYGKISAFQLKEMVVEEQNLTSKSTFYRIMEEIDEMDEISSIRQGKEKIYISKLTNSHTTH